MKILHVSNLVSHHQLPLARCLAEIIGEANFRFAATARPDLQRLRLGWGIENAPAWVLHTGDNKLDQAEYERWWCEADVVLCGDRLFRHMANRLNQGQLTFYMSERWWKPPLGIARMLSPKFAQMSWQFHQISTHRMFHYLPIGPFASSDISILAKLNERKWKWGYFTEQSKYYVDPDSKHDDLKILWVGRMLEWKRVDVLIRAVAATIDAGTSCQLTIVGDGPMRKKLENLASQILDHTIYDFRDPIPASEVQLLMSQHDVYVLPSNGYEGWGAVINEAMGCGCAVVASREAGAAAMIDHNRNGLLFRSESWLELSGLLTYLKDKKLRNQFGAAARKSILETWSPLVAAERFIAVADSILNNHSVPIYDEGPMACA